MAEEQTPFERRAKLVRPYFNIGIRHGHNILPPPFIVEFLGTPSAGKTTLVKEVDKFWKKQGMRCFPPQEGAQAVRYMDRTTPFYNIATGVYAFQRLMMVSEGHQYAPVLFVRCVFDASTWMKYWFKKGKLSQETMHMLQESFLMGAERIDAAFVVTCDPEVAMRRETKNEVTFQMGQYTTPSSIKSLIEWNKEAYEELSPRFPQLALLDTTTLDEKAAVQKTLDMILQALEKKILSAP